MPKFFKGKERGKPPFTYPAIVEIRKEPRNYLLIIGGLITAIILITLVILFIK